jgi:hypothetical protein
MRLEDQSGTVKLSVPANNVPAGPQWDLGAKTHTSGEGYRNEGKLVVGAHI